MKYTPNYNLKKPDREDYVIVEDFNENFHSIDELIKAVNDVLSTLGSNVEISLDDKADLDENKKILVSQLPDLSGYTDVLFYEGAGNFPSTGNPKIIYVDKAKEKIYRWAGTGYKELSKSLDIGTTAGTAYDGKAGADLKTKVDNMYTNTQIDKLLEDLRAELESDIIEQILIYS